MSADTGAGGAAGAGSGAGTGAAASPWARAVSRSFIATPFQVADLNADLARRGLAFRVHLHDMCGAQSLSVERLDAGGTDDGGDGSAADAQAEAVLREAIAAFFEPLGARPSFTADGSSFTLR